MVAVAVRTRISHRIVDHLRREAVVLAHHFERLGLADLAGEFLDLAVSVRDLDGIARPQEVQALTDAGQLADRGQVGHVQRHAAENTVQGVVSADHHFDGRADACLLPRRWAAACS